MAMTFHDRIFEISPDIRYVATYRGDRLDRAEREGIADASSSESDRYEELLVNPALLTLVKQRGDIDCGGAEFIIVGYGKFLQLVIALPDGHVSIAFEKTANPLAFVGAIQAVFDRT
ncbi:hypothetical protein ABID19_001827 [Mesorhizobium robiniae]|uniref:Uncharacterized protein n=1 Tax=Mesorhizobium robiniae TaxID=559315 RepID=A0ABV2GKH1_9HYPH